MRDGADFLSEIGWVAGPCDAAEDVPRKQVSWIQKGTHEPGTLKLFLEREQRPA